MTDEPKIPEAWRQPPKPGQKGRESSPAPPGWTLRRVMKYVVVILAGLVVLIVLAALAFLGTCLYQVSQH